MIQKILFSTWLIVAVFLGVSGTGKAQSEQPDSTSVLDVQGAQTSKQSSSDSKITHFLEIGIGPTAYKGDLSDHYKKWASAFYVGVKFNKKHRINGHFNLAIGTVTGQNAAYVFTGESDATPTPNRFFKTSFFSLNYDLQVNIVKTAHWVVYISQGIGFIRFNPKDEYNKSFQDQLNTRPGNETYGSISAVLPTQAGAIYLLSNGYGAGIQAGWLNSQTDYLDNISQWGNRSKKDNVLWIKFQFIVPLAR